MMRRHLTDRVITWGRAIRDGLLTASHYRLTYSQEGEDIALLRLFDGQRTGLYVDVGAHHPTRYSNTYLLYRRGWRGINIDPAPGAMRAFSRKRPNDVNLALAVSIENGRLPYFVFDEGALNTLEPEISNERARSQYRPVGSTVVETRRLDWILDNHLPRGTAIDLLTIDTEGHDLSVLQSNDWRRYTPRVVVIEVLGSSADGVHRSPAGVVLSNHGYHLWVKLPNSAVYVSDDFQSEGGSPV